MLLIHLTVKQPQIAANIFIYVALLLYTEYSSRAKKYDSQSTNEIPTCGANDKEGEGGAKLVGVIKDFVKVDHTKEPDEMEMLMELFNPKPPEMFRAVGGTDGLTHTFKAGVATALLGHNGAGKTTTIKMLNGATLPSEGDVIIDGLNTKTSGEQLQSRIGICQQFDVLYDYLTAWEHLALFGGFKGATADEMRELLKGVNMDHKADDLVMNFSGGEKRRLSVAISLLGTPKLLLLDEPTTGMDVISRRSVWEIIDKIKKAYGTTVILTTHSMEEADALCDEILVLSKGCPKASGTSLELKEKFGLGYHFLITKVLEGEVAKDGQALVPFDLEVMKKLLSDFFTEDGFEVLTDIGAECSFALPRQPEKFQDLFTKIKEDSKALGIKSMAVSVTTLEEVFQKIGHEEEEEGKEEKEGVAVGEEKVDDQGEDFQSVELISRETATFSQQLSAVFFMSSLKIRRNPMSSIFLILAPLIFVIASAIVNVLLFRLKKKKKSIIVELSMSCMGMLRVNDESGDELAAMS